MLLKAAEIKVVCSTVKLQGAQDPTGSNEAKDFHDTNRLPSRPRVKSR